MSQLIKSSALRELYGGISTVTLWRWEQQGLVEPDAIINGRKYYDESKHPKRFDHEVTKPMVAQK